MPQPYPLPPFLKCPSCTSEDLIPFLLLLPNQTIPANTTICLDCSALIYLNTKYLLEPITPGSQMHFHLKHVGAIEELETMRQNFVIQRFRDCAELN